MEKSIVCIHGRRQEREAKYTLQNKWREEIFSGIDQSQMGPLKMAEEQIVLAYYGDLFRWDIDDGRKGIIGQEEFSQTDQELIFKTNLVEAFLQEALQRKLINNSTWEQTIAEEAVEKGPVIDATKLILLRLDRIPGFPKLMLRSFVKDVADYFYAPGLREKVMERLIVLLKEQQQQGREIILVAHSLGTIVAYDVLNTNPDISIHCFITLGSPLGIRNCIYKELLQPGQPRFFPETIQSSWSNFYDKNDIIALVPNLTPHFPHVSGKTINIQQVFNRPEDPHSSTDYLNNRHVGEFLHSILQ